MFEESLNREDDQHTKRLIDRFEQMICLNEYVYFDSDDLEIVIDYYFFQDNKTYVFKALELSEKLFPFSVELKIKKAQVLISLEKVDEALIILNDIEPLAKNNEDFLFVYAVAFSKKSNHKKAIEILELIHYNDPNNDEVISNLANEYQHINENIKSSKMIEKLILLDTENDLYWYSYYLCTELIDENEANFEFIKKVISLNPYSILGWFYLGVMNQKKEDHLNAIEAFDYAILIDEEYTRSYSYKSESLAELGLYQKAIDTCISSFEFEEPNCPIFYNIAEYYFNLDNIEKALSFYYKALRKDDEYSEAWYSIAQILQNKGETMEALYHIKKAVEKDNSNIDYLYLYAILQEKVGFTKEAAIAYKKVLEIDNNDLNSWLDYSYLLFQQESKEEAIDSLYEALEHNPDSAKIYYRLSAYILELGDETKSLSIFKKALAINFDLHSEIFLFMPKIKENENLLFLLTNFK